MRRTEGKTRPLPGNLYAVLRRLMREDLIVESDAPPDGVSEDGRRRYYRITDFGLDIAAAEALVVEQGSLYPVDCCRKRPTGR